MKSENVDQRLNLSFNVVDGLRMEDVIKEFLSQDDMVGNNCNVPSNSCLFGISFPLNSLLSFPNQ